MLPSADLKRVVKGEGFDTVGVCRPEQPSGLTLLNQWVESGFHSGMEYMRRSISLRSDPATLLPGLRSLVMVTLPYNQPNPPVVRRPRVARYALGRDYHKVVRAKLRRVVEWLKREHPGEAHRVCVDSAPLLEREYAHRAGLGWFGKNTLLIDSMRGSWFVIGALLTTVEFEPDSPTLGRCGTCTACIDACPTGAIVPLGKRWVVDSNRCISALTIEHRGEFSPEQKRQVGLWTFGCDVCQEVCPFNHPRTGQPLRAAPTTEADFLDRRGLPALDVMVDWGAAEFDAATKGSALRRARLDGLRRNAKANLENLSGVGE